MQNVVEWCVGFVCVLMWLRVIAKGTIQGLVARLMITVLPWGIVHFIFMLLKKTYCG